LPEQQQENYLEAEWDEFSEKAVDQVYEDRLNEFPKYLLREELGHELAVKGKDRPLVKVQGAASEVGAVRIIQACCRSLCSPSCCCCKPCLNKRSLDI